MRAGESKAVMNEEQERSVRGRIGEIGGLVEWVGGRESRRQTDRHRVLATLPCSYCSLINLIRF